MEWSWTHRPPVVAMETRSRAITVGPTLVYGKDRQPRTVASTSADQVKRIKQAWTVVQEAWPEGHEVLALLTTRIIPLKAKGVVSFSYRHRPGLSFINCFDRDNLDLIDDVIHENSHHHLNLLLRKQILYHGDRNQQIFYSPWRRSLRPLRGILHAAFTFTMGAMLFERLSTWASGRGGSARWKQAGLTQRDLQRARFRCLEEVESVRYSIQDLEYARLASQVAHRLRPAAGQAVGGNDRAGRAQHRASQKSSPRLHIRPSPPPSYQGTPPSPPNLRASAVEQGVATFIGYRRWRVTHFGCRHPGTLPVLRGAFCRRRLSQSIPPSSESKGYGARSES